MLSIPNYDQRLRAMLFKARFHDRVDEIKPVRIPCFVSQYLKQCFLIWARL